MAPPQQPLNVRKNVILIFRKVGEGEGAIVAAVHTPAPIRCNERPELFLQRRDGRVSIAHLVEVSLHERRGRGRDRNDVGVKASAVSGIAGGPRAKCRASRDGPAAVARMDRHARLGIAHGFRRTAQESG